MLVVLPILVEDNLRSLRPLTARQVARRAYELADEVMLIKAFQAFEDVPLGLLTAPTAQTPRPLGEHRCVLGFAHHRWNLITELCDRCGTYDKVAIGKAKADAKLQVRKALRLVQK